MYRVPVRREAPRSPTLSYIIKTILNPSRELWESLSLPTVFVKRVRVWKSRVVAYEDTLSSRELLKKAFKQRRYSLVDKRLNQIPTVLLGIIYENYVVI